jgi:hypothetical protein
VLMSGAEIYRNFSEGAGTGGLQAGAAIVNEIAGEYTDEVTAIRELTARMESAWQGAAASAAYRGAGPLTTEHETSGAALLKAQSLTSFEAEVFALSKNSVVPVPPKPTAPDPWAFLVDSGGLVAFEDQVDDHNAAAKHNVAVMTSYTTSTSDISQQLPIEYGSLSDDGAGIEIHADPFVDTDDSDGATPDADLRHDSGSATEWRHLTDSPARGPEASSTAERPDSGPGSTSPGSFTPIAAQPGPTLPVGTARPLPTAPGTSFVGVPGLWSTGGLPEPGGPRGNTAGPRGGAPRNGSLPRSGGAPYEGALRGAAPEGATRSVSGVVAGSGRTASSTHGVPIGASGRGRDEEDGEHRRPAYLEGDDPDDLFGSEVLTAPPTIGAEDDD